MQTCHINPFIKVVFGKDLTKILVFVGGTYTFVRVID